MGPVDDVDCERSHQLQLVKNFRKTFPDDKMKHLYQLYQLPEEQVITLKRGWDEKLRARDT